MHLEFLIEDQSGEIALDSLVEKILQPYFGQVTHRIIAYKGIGHIPKNLAAKTDPKKRILLSRLPELLRGYGKAYQRYPAPAAVVVVVDSDSRDCRKFKKELLEVLDSCNPAPKTLFRIAIEELEAWFLGDQEALKKAYPKAKSQALGRYRQDSVCGTWELLADAIHPGGANGLKKSGWPAPGVAKCDWARNIAPLMDVDNNESPSFRAFRDGVRNLLRGSESPRQPATAKP